MGGAGPTGELSGREAIVDVAMSAVRAALGGAGGVVTLVGAPGIGKTSVLARVIDAVRSSAVDAGTAVLRCVGVETEQQLAFAGLSDLVGEHLSLADRLPAPQRASLLAAVALGPEAGGGNLAVASALLGVLREVAADRPVLVAIDDAHGLDAPSAEAIACAARRLTGQPIAIVTTCRSETVPPWLQAHPSIELPALDPTSAALLLDRVAADLSVGVREAILRVAAGVPLALVELPVDLDHDERVDPRTSSVLLRPAGRIGDLYTRRVSQLDAATREALLVAALTAHEDLDTIAMAWQAIGRSVADIAEAERVRLVLVHDGVLRFVHPLVRSALVHSATEGDRRRAQLALAEVLGADEVVTAHEALRAYTYGSAYASYQEDRKGWIGPGTLGDLVVLSDDPTQVDPSSLADIDVLATVVGGEVVWDAGLGLGDPQ
jgi:predicted ATPase